MESIQQPKCSTCEHPARGVIVRWFGRRIECAQSSTDDGIGDASACHCRDAAHAREIVPRRVID